MAPRAARPSEATPAHHTPRTESDRELSALQGGVSRRELLGGRVARRDPSSRGVSRRPCRGRPTACATDGGEPLSRSRCAPRWRPRRVAAAVGARAATRPRRAAPRARVSFFVGDPDRCGDPRLTRYAPLVECGAGMGYWTALL